MKYVFTAVFEPEPSKTNKNLLSVYFPDVPGAHSCGNDLEHAIRMAKDVLCMCLYEMEKDGKPIPEATHPKSIKVNGNEFITAIAVDTDEYRRFYERRAVRRSVSIPAWLNHQAEEVGAPFSNILQQGLKEYLKIVEPVGK